MTGGPERFPTANCLMHDLSRHPVKVVGYLVVAGGVGCGVTGGAGTGVGGTGVGTGVDC